MGWESETYDVQLMHLFQKDMCIKEYTNKFQVSESKEKLFANLVWDSYVSNMVIEIQT